MNDPDGRSIRIHLDVFVPVGGEVNVQGEQHLQKKIPYATTVSHPDLNGTTIVKQFNSRWHMCAFGRTDAGVRYVFAKVYDGVQGTLGAMPPTGDLDTLWTMPDSNRVWTFPLLFVPGTI